MKRLKKNTVFSLVIALMFVLSLSGCGGNNNNTNNSASEMSEPEATNSAASADELQHIEAYTSIQNIRFGGGIRLELEVTREWYTCEMPKIILQPLVENAILHGIMEKEPEAGIIRVRAWAEQEDLIIQLLDDGIGMDSEELGAIFKGDNRKRKGGGYGVRNIDERLKFAYGTTYGLKFESISKQGTCVYVRIPLKSDRLKA
ncbi:MULTISPECIES: sensor histidine kinase [Paenibacillus]|uniref:Histidine kinase/HSP90-like ATPase domain-containing protein n=1 Tax=Paenibacillus borealis TaxID=160799 RepID=A0ABX3HLZ3_PAEBO|nr:ATP-binding protein [Paenibacillus borealis]OMD51774.1 hypothetical protein BSK56_03855 [Paenibacillus borealis]